MDLSATPQPASIGRFRIDATLGSGGMGAVYKAFDPTLQRTVALKTVRPDIHRQEYLDRLYREAQACARLKHPNVVTVYEAGEVGGLVYMVMEFLDGEDLSKAIHRGGLTFETKARILTQILDALQHAHDHDVIHRDIKPSNVYRQPDGSIKVVDFGLARVIQADALTTGSGMVLGTAHYASPEQLKGLRTVDHRTDIYSVGVLAYEMLSGRRPFQTDDGNVMSVMLRVMNDPTPPMNLPLVKAFPQIEHIVSRAMQKSPDHRYQTALEMRNAVQAFATASGDAIRMSERQLAGEDSISDQASTVIAPRGPGAAKPKTAPNRMAWAASAAALLGVVGFGVAIGRSGTQGTSQAVPAPPAANDVAAPPSVTGTIPPPTPTLSPEPARVAVERPPAPAAGSPQPVQAAMTSAATAPSTAPAAATASVAETGEDPRAKQLFISETGSTAAGLRYRLLRVRDGADEAPVDPGEGTFKTGDKVRFTFESNIDGYLYVVMQGSSGDWTTLFPHPDINGGRNNIRRGEVKTVPSSTEGYLQFDDTPGIEHVFVFLSKDPVAQLPNLTQVKEPTTVKAGIIEGLQRRIQSRDLIFVKDRSRTSQGTQSVSATYVANLGEADKAVSARIALDHRQ